MANDQPAATAGPVTGAQTSTPAPAPTRASTPAAPASASRAQASDAAASVADAVKRVADAAVTAVQKAEVVAPQDFTFSGSANGGFSIRGFGFSSSGTVRIDGQQVETVEWGNEFIAGRTGGTVKAGKVTVEVLAGGKVQRGEFTVR